MDRAVSGEDAVPRLAAEAGTPFLPPFRQMAGKTDSLAVLRVDEGVDCLVTDPDGQLLVTHPACNLLGRPASRETLDDLRLQPDVPQQLRAAAAAIGGKAMGNRAAISVQLGLVLEAAAVPLEFR